MKNLNLIILFLLISLLQLSAQEPEEWMKEKKPLLFEKLYLQIDREMYSTADKIYLKAYQVNALTHELNSNFRNIFVQLVAPDGRVVKDLLLFSVKGQANGCITTDSVASGMYTIRAYTKYLENFGEDACFHKKIWISDLPTSAKPADNTSTEFPTLEVAFLPEGGKMVLNAANTIAFKAIGTDGKGMDVSGKIIDELGEPVVSFKTTYLGMGKLIMMPVDGKTYYAVIDQNPKIKIKLEDAMAEGVNLRFIDKGKSVLFVMAANMKQDVHLPFYFMISHKGSVAYRKIEMDDNTYLLNLDKDILPAGISKITLLDTMMNPFAERLIYVDKGDSDLISLQLDKQKFKSREKVNINARAILEPGDSLTSTLSVAVVNRGYLGEGQSSQNIKSYLLLDAELKGPIEMPASYFVDDRVRAAEKLDLLMMVNGWRSYIWDEVAAVDTASVEDWNDAGIEIKGFVKKLLWKAPLADAELTLASRGGNYTIEKTKSNEKGRFSFRRVYLSNITRVTINALTKNGTRNAEIRLDKELRTDTIQTVGSMENTCFDVDLNRDFYRLNSLRRMKEREFNPEAGSILLGDVDIRQKRSITDDGHFRLYSNPDKSLTITADDYQYTNVLDYLEGKIAGLTITGDQVSIRGGGQPLFLIDGMEVTGAGDPENIIREIRNLNMNEIDKVEVLKSGANLVLFGAQGGNGVIAIYRKTMDKIPYSDTYVKGRTETSIKGFHKAPKFYSPTYTPDNINDPQPDYRPTLLWDPELSFKDDKANIECYTSDELAHYVVVVEGITRNGKICYGTTNFEVDKE